ncbi:uncharacterized protein LOC123524831 isoform X2 [Mercenaria mercenaria]|uniref:uncharacterized protein LOC123524831 isoform X2 n=1 Tax=Mercenaria mercenaria TaxID=6596 RepID=UPI00234F873D|nr:uncharacterized protein LOC123524831 isoform X2 [Mercenaria mercenaria]
MLTVSGMSNKMVKKKIDQVSLIPINPTRPQPPIQKAGVNLREFREADIKRSRQRIWKDRQSISHRSSSADSGVAELKADEKLVRQTGNIHNLEEAVTLLKPRRQKLEYLRFSQQRIMKEKEIEAQQSDRSHQSLSADRGLAKLKAEEKLRKLTSVKYNPKDVALLKTGGHEMGDFRRNQQLVMYEKEKEAKQIDRNHQSVSADRGVKKLKAEEKLIKHTSVVYNLEEDASVLKARRHIMAYLRRNQQHFIKEKGREAIRIDRSHQSLSAKSGVSKLKAEEKQIMPTSRRLNQDKNVTFLKTGQQKMTDTESSTKRILKENERRHSDKSRQSLSAGRGVSKMKAEEKLIDRRSLQRVQEDTSTYPKNKTYILPPLRKQTRMLPQLPAQFSQNYVSPLRKQKRMLPQFPQNYELSEYLQKYYEDSAHFKNYRYHSLDNNCHFCFALVPTLQVVGCDDNKEPTSHIKKALSTECQHRPKCLKSCESRMTYQSLLLLTNETAIPGNYLVHIWLQSIPSSAIKLGYEHFRA